MMRNWLKSSSCWSIHVLPRLDLGVGEARPPRSSSDSVVAARSPPGTFTNVNWFRGRSKAESNVSVVIENAAQQRVERRRLVEAYDLLVERLVRGGQDRDRVADGDVVVLGELRVDDRLVVGPRFWTTESSPSFQSKL